MVYLLFRLFALQNWSDSCFLCFVIKRFIKAIVQLCNLFQVYPKVQSVEYLKLV